MRWTIGIFVATCIIFIIIVMQCNNKEQYAGNWDFMDLADMCGKKRRLSDEDIPHFGGQPNASEVWTI